MKKLISLLLTLLPLFLMAQGNSTYTLEGNTNTPATYVLRYIIDGKEFRDTGRVANGEIKLTGKINTKVQASLTISPDALQNNQGRHSATGSMVNLWLEPGHIKIDNLDSLRKRPVFSGSPLNDETIELQHEQLPVTKIPFGKQRDSLLQVIDTRFIRSHPNSLLSLWRLMITLSRGVPDITKVEPLFNSLSPAVKESAMGKDYQKMLIKWKNVDIGSTAPDFTQPDQNGKPVKLSDFKGKYVLLDFWASWCHPCREENPNLIKQYNLYKGKGFMIISISLDGGEDAAGKAHEKANWLKAINDDHVGDWTHLSDLTGSRANKVMHQYGVGSIPESFLIDPDGKIIGKSLRGEELNKKLEEIFNNPVSGNNPNDNSSAPVGVKVVGRDGSNGSSSSVKTGPGTGVNGMAAPTVIKSGIGYTDNDVLRLDPAVRIGRLSNGFTYYIRKNTSPNKQVTFYLANKVGSILENDNQQGLAHLVEHMNFDGTTHFPKYELVNYLQKAGIRFGADLNAYTGFDETVYQLPLPADNPDILKNGIQIMRDWAKGALLDSAEIYKEVPVVLEEKRMGKGAAERMRRQYLPVLLNHSRYAERLPIGIDEVLNSFKPTTLRDFYNDWYRPDLQALIVVGDIDVDQMEKTIREKFSDLKNPVNERERKTYTVPLTGQNQYIKVTDKEQTKSSIEVVIKHRAVQFTTAADYQNYIIQHLFNSMIGQRIAELSANKINPPFVSAGTNISNLLGGIDNYAATVVTNPGELEKGFKAVWRETERVKRFGFTQAELDRAKTDFLKHTESSAAQANTTNSNAFVNEYLQNFLKGIPSPGVTEELKLTKYYLHTIDIASLQSLVKEYIHTTNRDIIVIGSENDRASLPDEQKITQWMAEVDQEPTTPYQDNFTAKTLLSKEPVAGKVVKQKLLKSIDATEWTLSNGAKVILKKTGFSANHISFNAFAPGGSSVYSDDDYLSASNAAFILDRSGIGNLSAKDLNKFFSGKRVSSVTGISDYYERLSGNSSIEDLETLFQITYIKFAQPRYDKESFAATMAAFKASTQNRENSPASIFQDSTQAVLNNHNIRRADLTMERLAGIDLDKAFKIYNELISGNVSNFVFCFLGDLDTAQMKPLIEKYIASLPSGGKNLQPRNLGIHPPSGRLTKTIYKGLEPKASISLVFSGAYNYTAENNKVLDALKEIMQINLINRLRKDEGGVYSPNTNVTYQKIPEQRYRLRINFDCAPQNVEKLIGAALDEVNKIRTNGPDQQDVDKFKAEDERGYEAELKTDHFWIDYIQKQLLDKEDLNNVNDYKNVLQKVTKESVREAASKYLNDDNLIKFKLFPENLKP